MRFSFRWTRNGEGRAHWRVCYRTLSDGLVLVGVSSFWQTVIKGLVIVLAVILDQGQERLKKARAAAQAARSVRRELDARQVEASAKA